MIFTHRIINALALQLYTHTNMVNKLIDE